MISSYSQKLSVWAGLLAILVLVTGAASGAVPYYENLSGVTSSGPLVTYSNITKLAGTVQFDNSVYDLGMADGTVLKLENEGSSLEVDVGAIGDSNVFCQLYVKPVAFNSEPGAPPDGEATGLYVLDQTTNNLFAYTAGGWTNLDVIKTVPLDTWLGFAVHLDYDNSKFDVYVTTNGVYTTLMTKANSEPLDMSSSHQGYFSKLTVTNSASGTGCVDVVAVSPSFTDCVAANTNLLIAERMAGMQQLATRPPYAYSGASNLLADAQIGNDLSIGLRDNDQIKLFDDDDWTIADLTLDPPVWTKSSGLGTLDLSEGQGFLMDLGGTAGDDDTLAFYPHDGTAAPTPSTPVVLEMHAKGDTQYRGATDLAIPASSGGCVDINALNFATPGQGDEMLFFPPVTPVPTRYIYKSGAWKKVVAGGSSSEGLTLCPGDSFIYYNYGESIVTLTIEQ